MTHPPVFVVTCYSHCFTVTRIQPQATRLVHDFSQRFVYKTLLREPKRGWMLVPTKLFASKYLRDSCYHFHRHAFDDFIAFVSDRRLIPALYEVRHAALYTPQPAQLTPQPHWVPHPYQEPIINFLKAPPPPRSRLVGLRTGRGKTLCALLSIAQLGWRTVIVIKPSYLQKWAADILKTFDIKPNRLMTAQGGEQLKRLIALAKAGELTADFILISNRTYQNYVELYELAPRRTLQDGYDCAPLAFFETLQAGVLLIDEAHQDFYAGFKLQLHAHVPLLIALSATMLNDNPFLDRMYALAFPKMDRCVEQNTKNYIHAVGVAYRFEKPDRIRLAEYGSTFYSHSAFEKSVLKQPEVLKHYLELIRYIVEIGFIKTYQPGDKLAVFATSIAMCTYLTDRLKRAYPALDVRRYVEQDPYENVIDADIRVTTILSGGTAIDIPGLTTSILTINILSSQSNIQTLGRLRNIPDRTVRFYYLWCHQFPKHRAYHERRIEMLKNYAETTQHITYSGAL